GLALHLEQLGSYALLLRLEGRSQRPETVCEVLIRGLRSELLCPVERQVEVAAAVVDLAHLARRRLVALEEAGRRTVEGVGQHLSARLAGLIGQMFERRRQRKELAEGVPTQ